MIASRKQYGESKESKQHAIKQGEACVCALEKRRQARVALNVASVLL